MGNLSLKDKGCILISWALMVMYGAAEQQDFPQDEPRTWNEAREYCQVCFTDLVTLTPQNIQAIAKKISSVHWVGLRRNFDSKSFDSANRSDSANNSDIINNSYYTDNSTSNHSMAWSRWANGDPLTFQNWYPGWPVFRPPPPKRTVCCSCSCTCPTRMTSTTTTFTTLRTTDVTRFWDSSTPEMTNTTILWNTSTENMTNITAFSDSSTQNLTDVTELRDLSIDNVTTTTGLSGSSTQNVTDVSGLWESSTQGMTYTTGLSDSSTQNVTDVSGLWDSSTQNMTYTTGLSDSSTQNVTDVPGFWESSTQNMTYTTGLSDSSTQNVTDVPGFWESRTQGMTSSSGWTSASVSTTITPMTTRPPPIEAECMRSPMLPPEVPDTKENFIEDSCVAMLSFGAWVEKDCSEQLPSICYEDRYIGKPNVTNVTSRSAMLSWPRGPGNISHYLIEVKNISGGYNETNITIEDLNHDLTGLTPGTLYSVQVFPVKCNRGLDPQGADFYTTPEKIKDLKVIDVTNTSISLNWSKPEGNVESYRVKVHGRQMKRDEDLNKELGEEGKVVSKLIPGNLYTFTVAAGVNKSSTWSEGSNITAYTKPEKVSNLRVSNNTNDSLLLTWDRPKGNISGVRVMAFDNDSLKELFNEVVDGMKTEVKVTDLLMGIRVTLIVTALANNDTLPGDNVTIYNFTAPGNISNLTFVSTSNSLNATWTRPEGKYSSFTVELQLDGASNKTKEDGLTQRHKLFTGLKTAAKYTVTVYAVSGHLRGEKIERSRFTLPLPPTDAKVKDVNKTSITLEWKAPVNASRVTYLVQINSSFWGYKKTVNVIDKTSRTFGDLKSGTRYDFEVRTEAGGLLSLPANQSTLTVAEKREIGLSMLCTSSNSLLCDKLTTKQNVSKQLKEHFEKLLGNSVFWELEPEI